MPASDRFRDRAKDLLAKPMVGDDGKNPFADDGPAVSAAENENLYAAPAGRASAGGGQPVEYESVLPHRGGLILTFGLIGLVGSLASLGILVAIFLAPICLANLAVTLTAWIWGRADLRSIHSGAMDPSGRGLTMAGFVLGIAGTLITVLAFLILVAYAVIATMAFGVF